MRSKAFLLVLMFFLSTSTGLFLDSSHESTLSVGDEISQSDSKSSTDTSGWVVSPSNGWTTGGEEIIITGTGFMDMAFKNVTSDGEAYTWTISTANYVTSSGYNPSIGVDSNGIVHIVHQQWEDDELWYSTYDGTSWSHSKIKDCNGCRNIDIVIDSNDNIHLAHYLKQSGTTGYLKYEMYDGTSWIDQWSTSNVQNDQVAIALDAQDNPHISFSNAGTVCSGSKLAYHDGSSWSVLTIDSSNTYVGCDSSIAIDSNGFVHVAYRNHNNMDMMITSNISGPWQKYSIDGGIGVGYHSAMDIDSNDELHVVYSTTNAGNGVKYATGLSGSAWAVSNQGNSRNTFSMYIDQFDIVHISEYNGGSNLGYSMVAPGASRQSMTVDSAGDVGSENDIFVDSNNMVHIAYYDSTNNNLKYANRSTGMSLTQEITVQFGTYGSVTGTVVNDTTIRVTTPMAGQTADTIDLTVSDKDGNNHVLSSVFTFISPDDVDMDGVLNVNDDCPNVAGTSTQDVSGCPDADNDGYSDTNDVFPNDSTQWSDTDGDGYGDAANGNNGDMFPLDSTQWHDTDGDGFGDNPNGTDPDNCIEEFGNSTIGRLGCLDDDGDGWANIDDAFPFNAFETTDSDGDGVGDNLDMFPLDGNETLDSDGDGVGDNADAFPNNASETLDSDGDGLGDNSDPNPFQHDFTDGDGDTFPDLIDAFPEDGSQWSDTDGDGFGDNPDGNDSDAFITAPSQWNDSDGDGYGDNWGDSAWNETRMSEWTGIFIDGALLSDYCPDVNGNSTADGYNGCLDVDGNGIADVFEQVENNTETNDSVIDSDNDGVSDLEDACPETPAGAQVNTIGCVVVESSEDDTTSAFESFFSGDGDPVATTVGIGAILLALFSLLQTNAVAAVLPDTFRWVQVLRNNSKLTKEELNELTYLQSLVQAYFDSPDELNEELQDMKSDLTARYTNNEIKKETREKLFTLIDELLHTSPDELERIAHNDAYFGLAGTIDSKKRTELLEEKVAMRSVPISLDSTLTSMPQVPNLELKGVVSAEDGYEYLESPSGSGVWFIRNQSSGEWEQWLQ